jgi:hypothetical protein
VTVELIEMVQYVYALPKIREKFAISESRQPDGGISHLDCENPLLHI